MKITDSDVVFFSNRQFVQLDESSEKKTSKTMVRRPVRVSWDSGTRGIIDRVTINKNYAYDSQFNYSADVFSRSTVQSTNSDKVISHEQHSAMEKLVSGLIEKEVMIQNASGETGAGDSNGFGILENIEIREWEMAVKKINTHIEEEKLLFSSAGEVITQDGRTIHFSLDLSIERAFLSKFEEETLIKKTERVNLTDPLVISLDGKMPQLSDALFSFDLDADGETENISVLSSGSGFLALDKNNDQIINNGSELFGPETGNGFADLAMYDDDGNQWIDENDAVFSKLSVWTRDEDGKEKLISLKDAGIGAIALENAGTLFKMTDSDNNLKGLLSRTGAFLFENGKAGMIHQIDLAAQEEKNVGDNIFPHEGAFRILDPTRTAMPPERVSSEFDPSSFLLTDGYTIETSQSPMEGLLEKIKKLKEEMDRLLGKED